MHQPQIGERVLIEDRPEVPERWRFVWARIASCQSDDDRPVVVLMDVMGRKIKLRSEYVTVPGC